MNLGCFKSGIISYIKLLSEYPIIGISVLSMVIAVLVGVFVYVYYNNIYGGIALMGMGVLGLILTVTPPLLVIYDRCKNNITEL